MKSSLKKGSVSKGNYSCKHHFSGAKLWVFEGVKLLCFWWTPKAGGAANPMAAMMNDPAAMQAGKIHDLKMERWNIKMPSYQNYLSSESDLTHLKTWETKWKFNGRQQCRWWVVWVAWVVWVVWVLLNILDKMLELVLVEAWSLELVQFFIHFFFEKWSLKVHVECLHFPMEFSKLEFFRRDFWKFHWPLCVEGWWNLVRESRKSQLGCFNSDGWKWLLVSCTSEKISQKMIKVW